MNARKTVLTVLIAGCSASVLPATLRSVDVTFDRGLDRYHLVADTHLDAPPLAIYDVLVDFDNDRYSRISDIYKESGYLAPDKDGTPLVYTRVEGCLLLFCRSMRRVERLEVVKPRFIKATVVPDRSDFKYAEAEWTLEPEGTGTHVVYRMDMVPDFWLPPYVGPWFLKKTLMRGGVDAVNHIEKLAQQVERQSTTSAGLR
jgi:Polyketide cyclase / dehydrase and lipid transport